MLRGVTPLPASPVLLLHELKHDWAGSVASICLAAFFPPRSSSVTQHYQCISVMRMSQNNIHLAVQRPNYSALSLEKLWTPIETHGCCSSTQQSHDSALVTTVWLQGGPNKGIAVSCTAAITCNCCTVLATNVPAACLACYTHTLQLPGDSATSGWQQW